MLSTVTSPIRSTYENDMVIIYEMDYNTGGYYFGGNDCLRFVGKATFNAHISMQKLFKRVFC